MSNSNGKITAPVSIDDVKTVLGTNSNDIATLCTSSNINMWSRRKPIVFNSLFPNKDGEWYKGNINDDYYNGKNCYGIVKNGINLASLSFIGNPLYNRHITVSPNIYYNKPTGGSASPYRLGDFYNYNQNTPKYPYTGSKPYNDNVNIALTASGSFVASANFTYNYNGYDDFIGLSEMFGGGDLYLGIIIEAASNAMFSPNGKSDTLRTNPLAAACIGDKIDGTTNNSTGLSYTARCVTPGYSYGSNKPSESEKYFSTQEYIKVTACVVKKNGSNNVWFYPITFKWIVPSGAVDTNNYATIEDCKIRATITKMNDGSYWIYINKYDDLQGSIIAPANNNSILQFTQPLMFTPGIGNINVMNVKSSKLANESNKASTSGFNAYNINGWQVGNPINTVATQFKSSVSNVKFVFSFSIKSGLEKEKYYNAIISMDLPSSSGNVKTSDWVNVE
uniref:Capsid protein n=1 Tax=Geladintestivirus 3 TaxID=3233135 RepID=A0AAU8MFX3_9CAUD